MVDKWILLEGPCKKDVIKKNRKAKDDKTNGKNERINSKDCSAAVRVDGASSRRSAVYTTRRPESSTSLFFGKASSKSFRINKGVAFISVLHRLNMHA